MKTAPRQDENPPGGPLALLSEVARKRANMESELEQEQAVLVRRARTDGASWAAIASALGISRQAVHKKYRAARFGEH